MTETRQSQAIEAEISALSGRHDQLAADLNTASTTARNAATRVSALKACCDLALTLRGAHTLSDRLALVEAALVDVRRTHVQP